MKKIICLSLVLVLALLSFVSCGQKGEDDVPDGKLRARSAALDLWVFYPESFSVTQNDRILKLVSAEQMSLESQLSGGDLTDGGASLPSDLANVTVVKLDEGVEDLDAFVAEYKKSFSASYVFGADEAGKLGRYPRITLTYHFASEKEDKVLYRFCQSLVLKDGAVYAVTYTATEELYELKLTDARGVMDSLTFENVEDDANTALTVAADPVEKGEAPVAKEGLLALTNAGVDFVLYYPEKGWSVADDTGFLTVERENGESVSVTRGSAYAVQITDLSVYLDNYYYPNIDVLYGGHEEVSRTSYVREDASVMEVCYRVEVGGKSFTFLQAMYWRGGYIYTLLYTAETASYEAHLGDVKTMVTELTFS